MIFYEIALYSDILTKNTKNHAHKQVLLKSLPSSDYTISFTEEVGIIKILGSELSKMGFKGIKKIQEDISFIILESLKVNSKFVWTIQNKNFSQIIISQDFKLDEVLLCKSNKSSAIQEITLIKIYLDAYKTCYLKVNEVNLKLCNIDQFFVTFNKLKDSEELSYYKKKIIDDEDEDDNEHGRNNTTYSKSITTYDSQLKVTDGIEDSLLGKKKLKKISPSQILSEKVVICSICLEMVKNEAKLNNCSHIHCSECILEYAKRCTKCPVCKRNFRIITYFKDGFTRIKRFKDKVLKYDSDISDTNDETNENCMVCNNNENQEFLLICDACNRKVCHTYCDGLEFIPTTEWRCLDCRPFDN